jgi:hypothetical protein
MDGASHPCRKASLTGLLSLFYKRFMADFCMKESKNKNRAIITVLAIAFLLLSASGAWGRTVLVEAESFEDIGGWIIDQQFMDLMGSPYLLAHGLGEPVKDAVTVVRFPAAGKYRVWVRTRDWVAPWNAPGAPGKFQLLTDGKPLDTIFGTEGEKWHWQDGGTVEIPKKEITISLHDLTGFEGRCDAIVFSTDPNFIPPNEKEELSAFRRKTLRIANKPKIAGRFDLVVVGGGMAGTCAAISAARLGLNVALIQDRPVLGGNNSSEVRVWLNGETNFEPYPRIGDIVRELEPAKRAHVGPANSSEIYEDQKRIEFVKSHKNVKLFLQYRATEVETKNKHIVAVTAQNISTAERLRFRGRWFADCTGDGCIGYLAGADYEITLDGHMGPTNLWNVVDTGSPVSFPLVQWALDLSDKPFPSSLEQLGAWFWESGFYYDPIEKAEYIRDLNLRAMYGAWDALKNTKKLYPNHKLNWAAYIAGKRESRRLLGDVVLAKEDFLNAVKYPDAFVPCTWTIDLHLPDPAYQNAFKGDEFISKANYTQYTKPYWIPYRCLYSRNIENLFMAGRDISVTHEGLGAVRVMRTCGMMGEVVGMAASLCKKHNTDPRGVYSHYLDELKELAKRGVGKSPPAIRPAGKSEQTGSLPRLKVSDNKRFLITEKGEPFFWLGDTAWMLRIIPPAEVDRYMSNRVQHRFNVIQVQCGFNVTDYAGNRPFSDDNTDTPNEAFWRNIDTIVTKAHDNRLYIALVPMWGDEYSKAFGSDSQKAYRFGQWIGKRYASHSHVLWIVSGEYDAINGYRLPISAEQKSIFVSMARGLGEAHNGTQLMTIHPGAALTSSKDFHEEPWLDFNMLQSGHLIDSAAYKMPDTYELIARDYALAHTKPVLDGEPIYEDTPDGIWVHRDTNRPRAGAMAVRRKAYCAVFAGAFGHTYGHNDVYGFFEPVYPGQVQTLPKGPGQRSSWKTAIDAPGATQMKHLRRLMESRSHLDRIPDQSIIAAEQSGGLEHIQATRASDGTWALVYLPAGKTVEVVMNKLAHQKVNASWFDPRTGESKAIGSFANTGTREFTPPSSGENNDWVLVLESK